MKQPTARHQCERRLAGGCHPVHGLRDLQQWIGGATAQQQLCRIHRYLDIKQPTGDVCQPERFGVVAFPRDSHHPLHLPGRGFLQQVGDVREPGRRLKFACPIAPKRCLLGAFLFGPTGAPV
jgi:hypothetical protein